MLKIKKIEVKGFYSYKDLTVDFSKLSDINLIEGSNLDTGGSNGAGKSSIFEAIIWGLTGKTLRKSVEDALVNFDSDSCSVTIWINEYKIFRSKRPSKLQLFKGQLEITAASQKDTQQKIEELLNIDYRTLVSTMIYGQNSPIEFLNASIDEKRVIIKNFLNLGDIFELRATAKSKKLKISGEIKATETLVVELQKEIDDLKAAMLKKANPPSHSLEKIIELEERVRDARTQENSITVEIRSLQRQFNEILDPDTNCPLCGSLLDGAKRSDLVVLNHKKKVFLNLQIKEKEQQRAIFTEIIKTTEIPISSSDLMTQVKEYRTLSDKEKVQHSLDMTFDRMKKAQNTLGELKLKYELYKFWESAFSETGLIRYVIRNILAKLNQIANHYLKILTNGKYTIFFDDQLNETIFVDGKIVHYISLSGGEKNRIDLAVMLGLQQIPTLLNRETLNIILFDEIGGFLDEKGIDSLYILLKELKNSHNLFIITHNETLKSKLDGGFKLMAIKENGASRLEIVKGLDS